MEVYTELTPAPVAAASLGQVYRGRLTATGQEVAVKVQRPRIGESIAMDMLLLRRLMAAVDRYLPQASRLRTMFHPILPSKCIDGGHRLSSSWF